MVSGVELRQIMSRLGLSAQARAVIEAALARPFQKLRPGSSNVHGTFSSTKTVRAFRFGNPKVELPTALDLEYDPDVLAYLYRPEPLALSIMLADGSRQSVLHTPSFLVIRKNGAAYEDWTTEEELGKDAELTLGRFTRTVDGRLRCLPAEGVASTMGLGYIQRSTAETNPCVQANADYLEAYLYSGKRCSDVDKALAETLAETVKRAPGISVHDLRVAVEKVEKGWASGHPRPGRVANAINLLILSQRLYVDLRAERLTEPTKARVYADRATAQAWAIIARSSRPGPVDGQPGGLTAEGKALLLQMRRKDLALANERYGALRPWLAGTSRPPRDECDLPRSTRCRLMRQYLEAERTYGAGYIGLLPSYIKCGRRGSRYDERTITLVEKCVVEFYRHHGKPTFRVAYNWLLAECAHEGVPCPSYEYFRSALRERTCSASREFLA